MAQFKKWRKEGVLYECNPNRPVGKDTLSKWMKFLAKICKFTDRERIGNQNGRQQCIGKMNRHAEMIRNK